MKVLVLNHAIQQILQEALSMFHRFRLKRSYSVFHVYIEISVSPNVHRFIRIDLKACSCMILVLY